MGKKFILSILFIFTFANLFSQKTKTKNDEPDDSNIEKYLDDGKTGNVHNLVRFRVVQSLEMFHGLSYERQYKRFGCELGLYKMSNKYFGISNELNDDYPTSNPRDGFGVLLFPKYYRHGKYINNGRYIGILARQRTLKADVSIPSYIGYIQDARKCTYTSYALVWGSHSQFGKCFTFGAEWGIGYYKTKIKGIEYYDHDIVTNTYTLKTEADKTYSNLYFPLEFNFGFLF